MIIELKKILHMKEINLQYISYHNIKNQTSSTLNKKIRIIVRSTIKSSFHVHVQLDVTSQTLESTYLNFTLGTNNNNNNFA